MVVAIFAEDIQGCLATLVLYDDPGVCYTLLILVAAGDAP